MQAFSAPFIRKVLTEDILTGDPQILLINSSTKYINTTMETLAGRKHFH